MANQARKETCQTLCLKKGVANSKHLELPFHILRAKALTFQPLLDRVSSRIAPWKGKITRTSGGGNAHKNRGFSH